MPGPYLNSDSNSFALVSLQKRWPAIVDGVIKDIQTQSQGSSEAQKQEVHKLIQEFESVKSDLSRNAKLGHLPSTLSDAEVYNAEIDPALTWHDAPWLLSECLLYRQLQQKIEESQHWKGYDIFELTKNDTFEKSADAVATLADRYKAISEQLGQETVKNAEVLEVLFHEIISTSLWGNATDLSLLVTVSLEKLKKLQVAAENRDKETLLVNDFAKVWKQLQTQNGGRVDIVLDNSGFELYTDLILALFLLDTGLADQIVLHPKNQPWFVSDVIPKDISSVLTLLGDNSKFPKNRPAIESVVSKLAAYLGEGQLLIRTSPFWTSPLPFWEIKENGKGGGDKLWRDLKQSKLVIFKGDLNYRKLTGDLMWDRSTPFSTAIRDLSTSQVPFVTLRTVKADVCVGLAEGKSEELASKWKQNNPDSSGEGWAWSGNYAVVNFHRGL